MFLFFQAHLYLFYKDKPIKSRVIYDPNQFVFFYLLNIPFLLLFYHFFNFLFFRILIFVCINFLYLMELILIFLCLSSKNILHLQFLFKFEFLARILTFNSIPLF